MDWIAVRENTGAGETLLLGLEWVAPSVLFLLLSGGPAFVGLVRGARFERDT